VSVIFGSLKGNLALELIDFSMSDFGISDPLFDLQFLQIKFIFFPAGIIPSLILKLVLHLEHSMFIIAVSVVAASNCSGQTSAI